MTFPTTGILDSFTRGNEGPPPSADWTASLWGEGTPAGAVLSNECVSGASNGDAVSQWRNVADEGADCECYCTIPEAIFYTAVCARIQDEGTGGVDGYYAVNDAGTAYIFRIDNGAETQLGSSIAQAYSDDDKIGIECIGDQISAYYDSGGGWGSLGARTDATHSAAGKIAVLYGDTHGGIRASVDDFGGGTIAAVNAMPMAVHHYRMRSAIQCG